ncbi:MAG TPA: hypothetical protein VKG38_10855, partial [Solirubrobacteraceae bacterium]|nr:hypothetical protein [Solirubrobacteraceae bacterium]
MSEPLTVKDEATPFGVEHVELAPENEGGTPDTTAGSHPFQLTTTLDLNQTLRSYPGYGLVGMEPSAPALMKDVHFDLPPGLLGNPTAVPQCSDAAFLTLVAGNANTNLCPADTAIGVAVVTVNEPQNFQGYVTEAAPLFNLAPAQGEPARFGIEVLRVPVILDTSVRTGGDYGVDVDVRNTTQLAQLLASQVTFWGEPGDPRHDSSRGWACIEGGQDAHTGEACTAPSPRPTKPFLTLPTSCPTNPATHEPEALVSTVLTDSWLEPASVRPDGTPDAADPRWRQARAGFPGLEGCGALPFSPSIAVEPQTSAASTPTGMTVDVHVPQQPTLEPAGKAESAVRDTTVALPQGVQLSPSAANGLEACAEEQVGFEREEPVTGTALFSSTLPLEFCPNASKIGIVHIKTPLLPHELEGGAYLATQNANPFGSLIAMYIVARDPESGVLVKLAGEVSLNEQTLQLVSTFTNTPQVPFEDLKLELFGGPRASVTTPPLCGSYTTTTSFTPWSGSAAVTPSSAPFAVTSGPGGSPCPGAVQPFAPTFSAQATNTQAGAFTPFTMQITRPDPDQAVSTVRLTLPAGEAALLSSVTPCEEPQASVGACGPESEIGHTTVSAGLGPEPITPPQGQVFLTGPYKGAPFGLSIVAPAIAGPFNLGDVIVRSQINVNPETAAVTITSDPLPSELKGIPLQLKDINVTVDRPNFEFNPTSCDPK